MGDMTETGRFIFVFIFYLFDLVIRNSYDINDTNFKTNNEKNLEGLGQ